MIKKNIWKIFILIIVFKIFIYGFGYLIALVTPIEESRYFRNFHHYYLDERVLSGQVKFFQLWSYSDAQWYFAIADRGYYSKSDEFIPYRSTEREERMKFAFFPLWPIVISAINTLSADVNVGAFVASNIFGILAFYYLYKLIILYFNDEKLAFKSLLLLMFYPFSINYHLYFTEGLFLLSVVLVFYFLKKNKWPMAYLFAFLATLTKTAGIFIVMPILIYIIQDYLNNKSIETKEALRLKILSLPLVGIGFVAYMYYNYLITDDWLYFMHIQKYWGHTYGFWPVIKNFYVNLFNVIVRFKDLNFHEYGSSIIDYLIVLYGGILMVASWKKIPKEFFGYYVVSWAIPLFFIGIPSFGRYMSVCFPAFIYLASILKSQRLFYLVLLIFQLSYALCLIGVINWYWVG